MELITGWVGWETEQKITRGAAALSAVLLILAVWWWFGPAAQGAVSGFFRTADQQAQQSLNQGDASFAARRFRTPDWQAAAWYRAGDFKQAAGIYAELPGANAAFNQGNALVMSGSYADAIKRYDAVLQQRPGWQPALTNRKIAAGRQQRMEHDGADMTGGMLGADKGIRFDKGPPKDQVQQQVVEGEGLDQGNMQDIWLRRVQTRSGDFLRAKFAYQQVNPATAMPGTVTTGSTIDGVVE
jgi:Ca-activated chloride channel family protein